MPKNTKSNTPALKLKSVRIYCMPGLLQSCIQETRNILSDLWVPKNRKPNILQKKLVKNYFEINNIHIQTAYEIFMRAYLPHEIYLCIEEQKVYSKEEFTAFAKSIPWSSYLGDHGYFSVQVDSIASKAFHEGALKKSLSDHLVSVGLTLKSFEKTTNTLANETNAQPVSQISNHIFIELKSNICSVMIRLNQKPMNHRAFKTTLAKSAPFREDLAYFCLQSAQSFLKEEAQITNINSFYNPFGGTGTFVFENLHIQNNIVPCLIRDIQSELQQKYCPTDSVHFILKKSKANLSFNCLESFKYIYCDNNLSAVKSFSDNFVLWQKLLNAQINIDTIEQDFFTLPTASLESPCFVALNPPFDNRMKVKTPLPVFYKNIAEHLKKCFVKQNACGFILCPDESSWSSFLKASKPKKHKTIHFMLGGTDMRCLFWVL